MTNTDKTVLLPCPFCGGEVTLEQPKGERTEEWWGVVCRNTENLGGTCAIQQRPSRTKEAAIGRWNRRASRTQSPAEWQVEREQLLAKLDAIELGARNLNAYLKWQLSDESPGYAPTFPSAVAHFRGQFDDWVFAPGHAFFEQHQQERRAASITPPAPERSKEEVIPRLTNCGKYLAQDNTGNWHYLNHAGTWQGFQGPHIEPATPLPVTITDEMVEALYTAIEAHIRTVPLSYGIEPQLTNRLRSVIRIGLHAHAAALAKPGEQ